MVHGGKFELRTLLMHVASRRPHRLCAIASKVPGMLRLQGYPVAKKETSTPPPTQGEKMFLKRLRPVRLNQVPSARL